MGRTQPKNIEDARKLRDTRCFIRLTYDSGTQQENSKYAGEVEATRTEATVSLHKLVLVFLMYPRKNPWDRIPPSVLPSAGLCDIKDLAVQARLKAAVIVFRVADGIVQVSRPVR
jgi:hypothetical protein